MDKATVICLLALCASLTQGIGFKPELMPELKPELQPEFRPEFGPVRQPDRTGPQSASAPSLGTAHNSRTMSDQAPQYFRGIENASSKGRLLLMTLRSHEVVSIAGDFMASEEFGSSGEEQTQ